MVTKVITHLLTDTLSVLVIKSAFSLLPLRSHSPLGTDTNLQVVVENSFLPLHQRT